MKTPDPALFRNFLLSSWRYLTRHKVFTLINLACLTIGLACSFLVIIWMRYELSYDRFHEHSGRIFRVTSDIPFGEELLHAAVTSRALAEAAASLPDIEQSVRIRPFPRPVLRYRNEVHSEPGIYVSDPGFFQVFSFELERGDARTCLLHPASIVISKELARKYFGDLDPIGRIMEVDARHRCQVTGVFVRPRLPSHLKMDALLPMTMFRESDIGMDNPWRRFNLYTYVLLRPGVDPVLEGEYLTDLMKKSDPEFDPATDGAMRLRLQDIRKIHQEGGLHADFAGKGNRDQMIIFQLVALVILVIAMINFVNHTTARGRMRYREIAVRKTFGATRQSLVRQFIGESVILSLISLLLALALVEVLITALKHSIMEGLTFYVERDYWFIAVFLVISLLAGILAGIYPALRLSRLDPIRVLRVEPEVMSRRARLRRALVVIQFAVSIAILACALVVGKQIRYVHQKSLGFDPDNILYLTFNEELRDHYQAFSDTVGSLPGVRSTGGTSILPMLGTASSSDIHWDEKSGEGDVRVHFRFVDHGFLTTLGIPLVRGNNLPTGHASSDSMLFLVNEAFAKMIGDKEVLGLPVTFSTYRHGRVTGVVQDFHISSLHEPIGPLLLMTGEEALEYVLIAVHPDSASLAIAGIEAVWKDLFPAYPFNYEYLRDRYEGLYREEMHTYSLLAYFSVIALLISFLGLFGLASFRAEQGRREIGVRKVYGATAAHITIRYIRGVGSWILWSGILALPVAWYLMDRWLERFAYATAITPTILMLALLVSLVVALLASSWQTVLSARLNPAEALRYE